MASSFSYSTLASLRAAEGWFSVTGASIMSSPVQVGRADEQPSGKGAQASDGFAEDEVLDLIRSFVGVKSFGVREKACGLVVRDNAVAAKQLAGPCDGLATLG